jgi:hypothetical protein
MKITIIGEHENKSVKIATWEYSPEVVKGQPIVVEEEITDALRKEMSYYINKIVNA